MGEVKAGRGSVIGNAGEYLVVGELLKRGVIAAPAPRNSPGFDVLATDGTKSLNIRVKTRTQAADSWVWICKKDDQRTIFKNLSGKLDFTVLVDLKDAQTPPEYYVAPTAELNDSLRAFFERWVHEPPKRGNKPHDRNSRMYRIGDTKEQQEWVSQWKGAWHLILLALEATN